jgi:hypothetical protein
VEEIFIKEKSGKIILKDKIEERRYDKELRRCVFKKDPIEETTEGNCTNI